MDQKLVEKCSKDLLHKASGIMMAIVTFHMFTSFAIGIGIGWGVYRNPILALAIFVVFFFLLISIDRTLIMLEQYWSVKFVRFLLLLSLPILHMAFFDLIFFEEDIKRLFEHQRQINAHQISVQFKDQKNDCQEKIENLNNEIKVQNDLILEWEELNVKELNGTGGTGEIGDGKVYNMQQQHIRKMEQQIRKVIDDLKKERKDLKTQLIQIGKSELEVINKLGKWEDTGLLERLSLLKAMMWSKDNLFLKLFSLAWLVVFLAIDSIAMHPAMAKPFDEYRFIAKDQKRMLKEVIMYDNLKSEELSMAEIQAAHKKKILDITADEKWDKHRGDVVAILRRLDFELNMIDQIQTVENSISKKYNGRHRFLAQESLEKAFKELDDLIKLDSYHSEPNAITYF